MSSQIPLQDGRTVMPRTARPTTRKQSRVQGLLPYLFISPAVIPVILLFFYPLVYVLWLSLQRYVLFRPNDAAFIGFENFVRLLSDPGFWQSIRASGIWVIGSIIPQFVLGLALALLLNQRFLGRSVYRSIVIAPWAIGGVLTGLYFTWLFNPQVGVVNDLLSKLGLIQAPIAWGLHETTAWLSVMIANVWRGIPFFAIILLAALQSIDRELYEAAKIDGAGTVQQFRFITLPLIKNQAVLSTMLRSIWVFGNIDLIWTMTEGGPAGATRTLPVWVLQTSYKFGDFGYGAAIAVVIFLVSLALAFGYLWLGGFTRDMDEGE